MALKSSEITEDHQKPAIAIRLKTASQPLENQGLSSITATLWDGCEKVSNHPDGIRLSQLMEAVNERFGKSVTFHTCSAAGMDLDALLHFLEARDKVRVSAGVVYPGGSPSRSTIVGSSLSAF